MQEYHTISPDKDLDKNRDGSPGGRRDLSGSIFLMATALIWGFAFVAQSVAMDYLDPLSFMFARFALSGAILILAVLVRHASGLDGESALRGVRKSMRRRTAVLGGILCGIFLFAGSALQQFGVKETTAGNAGFLTAIYIIMVPVYGIFLGKKVSGKVWAAVLLAVLGLYLLCMEGGFSMRRGDFFCLMCAMVFPLQILAIDRFVKETDSVQLACVQFITVAVLSGAGAVLFEAPSAAAVLACLVPILYAGVLSGAVAYTFQIVGQKRLNNPTAASLLMSLESVFAAVGGWLILGQGMTMRKLIGCIIMFAAIVLAQL